MIMDAKNFVEHERLAFLTVERLYREYSLSAGYETSEGRALLDDLEKKLETGNGELNNEDFILLIESLEYYSNLLKRLASDV